MNRLDVALAKDGQSILSVRCSKSTVAHSRSLARRRQELVVDGPAPDSSRRFTRWMSSSEGTSSVILVIATRISVTSIGKTPCATSSEARRNVDDTFETLNEQVLEDVARCSSHADTTLVVAAGASHGAGSYLASSLQIIGVRTVLVTGVADAAPALATLGSGDVVVGLSLWLSSVDRRDRRAREAGRRSNNHRADRQRRLLSNPIRRPRARRVGLDCRAEAEHDRTHRSHGGHRCPDCTRRPAAQPGRGRPSERPLPGRLYSR